MQMSEYRLEQFKFDFVYKFFLGQTACVEIMHKGEIKLEIFPVPTYCQFMFPSF
jgi:hypothetical protein